MALPKPDAERKERKLTTHSDSQRLETQRFIKALNQAMVVHGLSQRGLCERLGIQIGTLTKYLRGEVAPLRVGTAIQAALAVELGVTTDALLSYYRTGEYTTAVSLSDVESWIRSEAGQRDLPAIMASLQEAGQRWIEQPEVSAPVEGRGTKKQEPYTWPLQELKDAGISDRFRERLGLTDAALKLLAETGEFDEELAEAFSVACNYELEAVIEAFRNREPII
jgi:transcriptional regulator with XRE-family HTH domain